MTKYAITAPMTTRTAMTMMVSQSVPFRADLELVCANNSAEYNVARHPIMNYQYSSK